MNKEAQEKQLPYMPILIGILAIIVLLTLVLLPFFSTISLPVDSTMQLDSHFNLPMLPMGFPYHANATTVLTWIMLGVGLVGLALAGVYSFKHKDIVPVMIVLSGAVIAIPEVFYDVIGCVLYPFTDDNNAFTIIGRQMPWFIIAGWFGFASPFLYMLYVNFKKGVSAKKIWVIFLISAISSVPVEEALLYFDVYYYYGNQPLILFSKHPFWWAPCNAGGLLLAAALVYRLEPLLKGWRSLAILFLTPMAVTAAYGFIAMPSWIVVNGDYSWLVTQAAGVLTVIMGGVMVSLIIRFVIQGDEKVAP